MKRAGATASIGIAGSPLAGAQGTCSYGTATSVTYGRIKLCPGGCTLPVRAAGLSGAAYDAAVPEFRNETLLTESEQQGKPGPRSERACPPSADYWE